MDKKPVAIVLGGTHPHITLIEKLQKRGYYTILVDYFKNPVAKNIADEHLQESTLDKDRVLEIARKQNAKLVISVCIDQANVTACYVAEKLNLPAPYSYKTALSVTNKGLMKEKMIKGSIPTAKYIFVDGIADFKKTDLKFPVIVKPADSNSSKGVKRADNYKNLEQNLELALVLSRGNKAIIEEYMEGVEIGIDCYVKDKKAIILMTKERRKIPLSNDSTQQIYGCIWPADLSQKNNREIQNIADKIVDTFNLDNTPLMIQAIVSGNEINVIEFGVRIGGGESFRIIKLQTNFDFVDAAIDSFLGNEVTVDCVSPEQYYAENFIYAKPGLFDKITGSKKLICDNVIEYLDPIKTKGMEVGAELTSNNRVGVFAVRGSNKNELFEKINIAVKNIEVYDINNNPIMRKDIYK